jgi:hypothetical protein
VGGSYTTDGKLRTEAEVTAPAPTNPTTERDTEAALAAQGTTDLETANIANSTTKKCTQISLASTGPCTVDIATLVNDVETIIDTVVLTTAAPAQQWRPPHADYMSITGTANNDRFRAKVTSLEPAAGAAQAVSATFYLEE